MKLKSWGILCTLIGFGFIINSSVISITGYVVSDGIKIGGSILGLVFIIGGLGLFLASQKAGGGLERKIKVLELIFPR